MLSSNIIEAIRFLIAIITAYIPTVTLTGYLEAWTARKLGDHSEYVAEFITLNPLMHINPLGLGSVIVAIFAQLRFFIMLGFAQPIPINLQAISGAQRWLKLSVVVFVRPLAHLGLLILTVINLFLLERAIGSIGATSALSSLGSTWQLICIALIILNMLAFILYTVYGLFKLVLVYAWPEGIEHSGFTIFMYYALPLLMFICLGPYLRQLLLFLIYGIDSYLRNI